MDFERRDGADMPSWRFLPSALGRQVDAPDNHRRTSNTLLQYSKQQYGWDVGLHGKWVYGEANIIGASSDLIGGFDKPVSVELACFSKCPSGVTHTSYLALERDN